MKGKSPETLQGRLSGIIAGLFMAAVVFTSLAHGGVEPWSIFVFQLFVLLMILVWTVKTVIDRRLSLFIPHAALPVAGVAIIGAIQAITIEGSDGQVASLSMDPEATRATVTVLSFLVIALVIGSNFFRGQKRLVTLSYFLITFGLVLAVFALIQHFTWNGKFYWIRPNTVSTSPFGPFVNHNHFAGFMELLVPIPVGLVLTRAVRSEVRFLYVFAAIIMAVALVASLSRGGMISLTASLLFLAVMGGRLNVSGRSGPAAGRRLFTPRLSRWAAIGGIAGVVGLGIIWIGADSVINRLSEGRLSGQTSDASTFHSSRGWVWGDTIKMIGANPILGVGLGAYGTAFPLYTESDGSVRVPQAHNDYLQIVADCGIAGGALALWFIVILFRAVARGIKSADRFNAGLALGTGAGLFALMVHSIFDFNLQLPSNALLFLLLTSVVTTIAAERRSDEGKGTVSLTSSDLAYANRAASLARRA